MGDSTEWFAVHEEEVEGYAPTSHDLIKGLMHLGLRAFFMSLNLPALSDCRIILLMFIIVPCPLLRQVISNPRLWSTFPWTSGPGIGTSDGIVAMEKEAALYDARTLCGRGISRNLHYRDSTTRYQSMTTSWIFFNCSRLLKHSRNNAFITCESLK